MAWRDRMRPASFRGVPFYVDASSNEFGRRLQRDELVGIPGSQFTDFDEGDDVYGVEAFLFGDDYDVARDALKAALLEEGPGDLVFGTKGSLRVRIVDRPRINEQRGALGYCVFSFTAIVEPETQAVPSINLSGKLSAASEAMKLAVVESFVETYDVDGLPDSQFGNIKSAFANVVSGIRTANGKMSSTLGKVDAVSRKINAFSDSIDALVLSPNQLAGSLASVVYSVTGLLGDIATGIDQATGLPQILALSNPFDATASARALVSSGRGLVLSGTSGDPNRIAAGTVSGIEPTPDDAITVTRKQEARAAHSIYAAMRAASIAGIAEQVANMELESVEQANEIQSIVADGVDSLFQAPAGTVSDNLIQAAEDVLAATSLLLRDSSKGLGNVRYYSPRATVPMVLIAMELYGDPSREAELLSRNKHILHPLFVEKSDVLEVVV